MPLPAEEVLQKLTTALEEAKQTTRDLHAARATALDQLKQWKSELRAEVREAVDGVARALEAESRRHLVTHVEAVIERIERDWREKLGLK